MLVLLCSRLLLLVWSFCSDNICTRSINNSFITLISKTEGPSRINDYMPISLLNSSMKIITKILWPKGKVYKES